MSICQTGFYQRKLSDLSSYLLRKSPNNPIISGVTLLKTVNLNRFSGYTIVSVKFIRCFLRSFTFFLGEILRISCVKFISMFARKLMKKMPITQYLFQCLIGRSSIPSFSARMNFSTTSRCL